MHRLVFICLLWGAAVAPIAAKAPVATQSELAATADRKIPITTWAAEKPRGVIVFGHGIGGEPAAYTSLIERWRAAGYTVVAPLAVDSQQHPDRARFNRMSGFMARIEDLQAVRGHAAKTWPGKPVFLAGHSYGSLFALYGSGASGPAGPLGGPPVAATIALSSPGAIPGLVTDQTFAGVKGPLLVITGTADTVPGLVPDPAAHRLPFDRSAPDGKLLVVFKDGGHDLAVRGTPEQREAVARLTVDFLDAFAADAAALKRVAAVKSTGLYTAEHR